MGHWKAVRLAKAAPLELYDLENDPHEERDVAAGQRRRGREDRAVPAVGADRVGPLGGEIGDRRQGAGRG